MKANTTLFICCSFLLSGFTCMAQPLTLEQCYTMARMNYPLVKQQELIKKSGEYSVENISKGYLPQLSVNGQATYQSDVTKIPISLPNVSVPTISKDQYRLYGEVNQPLTDLVTVKQQKELAEASVKVQEQSLEVELYKLKERVNQLYFGILLIDEQVKQNGLFKKDIQTAMNRLSAAIRNGVEIQSNFDKLKAEMLRATQRDIELLNSRKAFTDMLSLFINRTITEGTLFEKPQLTRSDENINRPEISFFDYQKKTYDLQSKLVTTRTMPKFFLFVQGGVGRPSPVNMLSNNMSGYYLGGLRLNWSLSNYYTYKKEKEILNVSKSIVDVQREAFIFNTRFAMKQQNAEIVKLQELINTDSEIVTLRSSIKNTASAQLGNGVITVSDYLREVNAEDQARQAASLHQVQLLMAQYTYKTTSGN